MGHGVNRPASVGAQGTRTIEANQTRGHLPNLVARWVRPQEWLGLLMAAGDLRAGKRGSGEWESRIGSEAANSRRRYYRYQRIGGNSLLVWVVFVIGFQVAPISLEMEQTGLTLSTLWMAVAIVFMVRAIRSDKTARHQAVTYLGMPDSVQRWVPLRDGPKSFHKWLSSQDKPGWPRKGWKR